MFPPAATIVRLICGSDKTQRVDFYRNKKDWLIYLTIGNIDFCIWNKCRYLTQNCTCSPPSATQILMEFCIRWLNPEGYNPVGAVWDRQDSVEASHRISRVRRHQFQCSVAWFWQQNAALLANSRVFVSRSQGACEAYGRQVQCLP
jgi:hypothetical protein